MASLRDLYKSWHPDYFSDSERKEATELDRSLLEFQLGTLTGRSQEADFERFARRLCEREICPNLLPTSGPTGGGDSKADSETFPVADELSFNWFNAEARPAASERWAFAFSAKKDWLPKIKSDIEKIAGTGRGYAKAFFVTNQAVPAKKRATTEDDLKKKHSIDVRILDRNWILERLFTGRHEDLALTELKVTGISQSTLQTGPKDTARLARIEATEKRIAEAIGSGDWGYLVVDDAIDVADAYRSVEKSRMEVEGSYVRADRLAMERGIARQQVEVAYQWAWTLFWWFEDIPAVLRQYETVEARAKDSDNVYDLERLCNLWTILNTHAIKVGDNELSEFAGQKREALAAALDRLAAEEDRPSTALQAHTFRLQIALRDALQRGEGVDPILQEIQSVAKTAKKLIGFPLDPLFRIIQEFGKAITDSEAYDSLLLSVADIASRREGEIRAAKMLLERGEQLLQKGLPAKSIAMIGQALGRLYKHETRKDIVAALFLCGHAYERVGLLWAARGVYLSGAGIAVGEYWRYGEVTPALVLCAEAIRRVELLLGRLPHLLAWHEFYLVMKGALYNPRISKRLEENEDGVFEALLARLLMRTSHNDLPQLERLPEVLRRVQLEGAADASLFLLGYPEGLQEVAGESADSLADKIWSLEADVPLAESPHTYLGQTVVMKTKILGCQVKVLSSTTQPCVEVGESILASLEGLLATSTINRVMPLEPEVSIDISVDAELDNLVVTELTERLGRPHMVVRCRPCNPYDISATEQNEFRQVSFEAALDLLSDMVTFQDVENDLRKLFEEERASERTSAGTAEWVRNVHGKQPKFRLSEWMLPSLKSYSNLRSTPWKPPIDDSEKTNSQPAIPLLPGEGEPPPGLFDVNKIAHHQMGVVSPIRLRLWDRAAWKGALYTMDPYRLTPPAMGLIFADEEAGRQIFEAWRSEIGTVDAKGVLRLTVIRGIDRYKPKVFRIMVSGNAQDGFRDSKMVASVGRLMTIDPSRPEAFEAFLQAYQYHKRLLLLPVYLKNDLPEEDFSLAIELPELQVRQAWEIGPNDLDCAGIQLEDDVVIPARVKNPPVAKLFERRGLKPPI